MTTDGRWGAPVLLALAVVAAVAGGATTASAADGRTVQVHLDDYSIDMPSEIEAGEVTFEVINGGQAEHTISIENDADAWRLRPDLLPGQRGRLTVDLEPGEYYVWCPIGRHEDYGMHTSLAVTGDGPAEEEAGAADQPSPPGSSPSRSRSEVLSKHTPPRPEDLGTATGVKKLLYWLGNFHPPLVSFPIALVVAAALAELLLARTGRRRYEAAARYCLWLAAVTGLAAGVLGWCYAGFRLVDRTWVVTTHRWVGTGSVVVLLVVLWLSETARRTGGAAARGWYLAVLLLAVAAILTTGFFGGAMIYGLDHYAWW